MRQHHEERRLDQAKALQAAGDVGIRVVDRHRALHFHLDFLAVHLEGPIDHTPGAARKIIHCPMVVEIFKRMRVAVFLQIGGRRAGHAFKDANLARHQRRILQFTHSHHAVHTFLQQVDRSVGQAELQVDIRVARVEFTQRRDHQQAADRPRHVDAQLAVRLLVAALETGFGLFDVRENPHASLVVGRAIRRQRQTARRAMHQARAEKRFQILNDGGDRSARQIERFSGFGKAVGVDDTSEHLHGLESVHG